MRAITSSPAVLRVQPIVTPIDSANKTRAAGATRNQRELTFLTARYEVRLLILLMISLCGAWSRLRRAGLSGVAQRTVKNCLELRGGDCAFQLFAIYEYCGRSLNSQ